MFSNSIVNYFTVIASFKPLNINIIEMNLCANKKNGYICADFFKICTLSFRYLNIVTSYTLTGTVMKMYLNSFF